MIDLHTHVLPNIDDGSKSPEETATLLKLLQQQGISTVVATPHFYAIETPAAFLKRRDVSFKNMPAPAEDLPEVILGAEVAYFSGIGSCEEIIPLQLGNTRLLLIEMPFTPWTDHVIEDICDIPVQLGLIPVLAHINRYPGKHQFPKYKDVLLERGTYFQCNVEAFLGFQSYRKAMNLLKNGYIHFLGSDAHNITTRPPQWTEARAIIEKKMGNGYWENFDREARSLFNSN